jgi:S-adenosylmethionine/arginine decarboxylase-like enzyme
MINASHVSCHTFPKRRFVSIDVYTCHDSLDRVFVEKYFKQAFGLQDLEVNYIKRGTRFPALDL